MTTKGLRIGKKIPGGRVFTLPVELATQTVAILAIKGAGKTVTGKKMLEALNAAGSKFVMLDPTGVAWGLRAAGSGPALEGVVIVGGPHGDYPLEPGAGALIADLVVDHSDSIVIDLSEFTKGKMRHFAMEFAEHLYLRQAALRQPLHVMLDEADEFLPQRTHGDTARLLGAFDELGRHGRSRGIGMTVITQRPAKLNKDILTQCELLVVMRMIGRHDRIAMKQWLDIYGDEEKQAELNASIATLKSGEAFFWGPTWGVFDRVQVDMIRTFDSSRTPVPGESIPQVELPPINRKAFDEKLAAAKERMDAQDPKKLQARIRELELELKAQPTPEPEIVEVQVIAEGQVNDLRAIAERVEESVSQFSAAATVIGAAVSQTARVPVPARPQTKTLPSPRPPTPSSNGAEPPKVMGLAERKILTVLAQYPEGREKTQIALLANYSSKGGGFGNAMGSLRSHGYMTGGSGGVMQATSEGLAALGGWEPLPSPGPELIAHWLSHPRIGRAERSILEVLTEAHPAGLSKGQVADEAGIRAKGEPYAVGTGGFNNALGKLRTLELIEGRDELRAVDTLF